MSKWGKYIAFAITMPENKKCTATNDIVALVTTIFCCFALSNDSKDQSAGRLMVTVSLSLVAATVVVIIVTVLNNVLVLRGRRNIVNSHKTIKLSI